MRNVIGLKQAFLQAVSDIHQLNVNGTAPAAVQDAFAEKWATAIDDYIDQLRVVIPAGTPITTSSGPGTIAAPVTVKLV